MGNENSISGGKNYQEASQYGGIFFRLSNNVFFPGDTVTGEVYLDLRQPYPGDKLCFEIKGEEYAKWVDRERRTRTKPDGTLDVYYVNVTREAKHSIIKQELTIYDWASGQIIQPGQYNFPVSFKVPQGLPGSFFFMGGSTVAEIEYDVEAFLKPERANVPKLKHKRDVVVRENLQGTIQQKEVTITKPLKTWCCVDSGTVVMKTSFEKSAYAPGEEARVITEVDNSKCSLCIQNMFFSLNQTISLTAGAHHRSFPFNIRSLDLGGAQPGECFKGDSCKIGSIQLPPGQEGRSRDYRGENAEISDAPLDPKMFLTPSTHGRLVKSDFHLTVSCNIDGCLCCDSPPSTSLPVQIYSAARMPVPDPKPPVNWAPQQMPTTNLTITIVQRADGGQDIHIQQGESNPVMPQQNFGQTPQTQMPMNNQMMNNNMVAPPMNNGMNNQMYQPMNNNMGTQPMTNGYPPMGQQTNMGEQPMMNSQPGYQPMPHEMNMNPQYMTQPAYVPGNYGVPQTMNPQQVQIGQNQF
jgi:sporulation-control protein spo0M